MLWKIERFDERCARGWVCLADRSASAKLVVYTGNGERFGLECNFMRGDIKRLGLHETGQCGFFIGPNVMKDLHKAPIAAIFEEESRLLLYRHSSDANFVDSCLLFLTAPGVDTGPTVTSLSAHHRLSYGKAESMDEETLTYLFKQTHWTSILIGAALATRPLAVDRALASGHYNAITLISRPATVFMRQVWTLAAAAKEPQGQRRLISDPDLAELIERLQGVDLRRPKDIERWLGEVPATGLAKLSNPLVRFYSGASLDDEITSSQLSAALRTIGLTNAVGLTERFGEFVATVGALIGVPDLAIAEEAPEPGLQAAIEAAGQVDGVAELLAYDQTLYDLAAYALTSEQPSLDAAGRILGSEPPPLGFSGRGASYMLDSGASPSPLLVATRAGENPSFDYFLKPRLEGGGSLVVDLDSGPGILADRRAEDLQLVFCRYVPPRWLAWTLRRRHRLGGLGIFLDDDYAGLVLDRTVPLRYRWKVMRLGLMPWRALFPHFTHVWTGSEALADRLGHANARSLTPIASAEDLVPPVPQGHGRALRLAFHATAVHRREHLWLAALADRIRAAVPGATLEVVADRRIAPLWAERPWVDLRAPHPWPAYRDTSRRRQADLFLVPLVEARINEGRSFSKVIDAVRLGAVPLLADTPAYRSFSGLAPLIPAVPEAWVEAIARYGSDADLRRRVLGGLRRRLEADRANVRPLL